MKWPESLTLIRHARSAYNELKTKKAESRLYQAFKTAFEQDPESAETHKLAQEVKNTLTLNSGDHNTPLAPEFTWQAKVTGEKLKDIIEPPDVIFVSPYLRTYETLYQLMAGWPELKQVKIVEEERIREQDHGISLLYNDWRVFCALNPGQFELKNIEGNYWYRFPQGENAPDVRERLRSWLVTLIRDFREQNVLAVTHHLAILSLRANLERLDAKEFLRIDRENEPINCGVTLYRGYPELGQDGKLILKEYNLKLY